MRVVLFTGKGGVGKTTVAAATALRCADAGLRTLVVSTDPAHSLADAFDVPLGSEPREIEPGLWGQQLDAQERMEETWGEIKHYLLEILDWAGVDAIEAEELAVLPGLDEIFALSDIAGFASSGEWDMLVVDCAPTAETIRLLSLPEILSWYMERVFPAGRKITRVVGPVVAKVTHLPVAGDSVFGATHRLYQRLEGARRVLTDPEHASVRLVVNPERMVIAEARRTHTYLSLFGYHTDAVIANRLLPDDITDPWFAQWKDVQATHLRSIEEGFAPLPILRVGLAPDELVGVALLRAFGDALYGDSDPAAVLHRGAPFEVRREGRHHILSQQLPFADHDDLELGRRDDELLIRVGPYRRCLLLPDSLRRRRIEGATLRNGVLHVTFGDPAGTLAKTS